MYNNKTFQALPQISNEVKSASQALRLFLYHFLFPYLEGDKSKSLICKLALSATQLFEYFKQMAKEVKDARTLLAQTFRNLRKKEESLFYS